MAKEIKLDLILKEQHIVWKEQLNGKKVTTKEEVMEPFRMAMKEAVRQALEIAAEEAKVTIEKCSGKEYMNCRMGCYMICSYPKKIVDKSSITDVIKLVK